MKKKALIFGITGQDGSYLAPFLMKKNILFMVLSEDHHLLIQGDLIEYIKIHIKKKENLYYITAM